MHLFWAKTNSGFTGAFYKPVGHHLLDVAACAMRFLQSNPRRLAREALLTGLPPQDHAVLCGLLGALHDLGKVSRAFQFNVPTLWPVEALGPCPEYQTQSVNHWEATALLLNAGPVKEALTPVFAEGVLDVHIIAAVAGHHGEAPKDIFGNKSPNALSRAAAIAPEIGEPCVIIAAALCRELVALFPTSRGIARTSDPQAFSFALNGLITLADWVGSDAAFFGFADPALSLGAYWPLALARADRALAAKGLLPARCVGSVSLAGLSDHAKSIRPMQAAVAALDVPPEPQLILIEDGTGSGKTEAALLLAARLMAAGQGEGVFACLPTMATANAMHGRLDRAMGGLFDAGASLVLAHGKAGLAMALDRLDGDAAGQAGEVTVASRMNAWIGDSRKKAFFGDAGAATIDQAFLAILPKKHLTLRQYALAGRVLIIDEAHACDAYMGEELKVLVEMHARLGGSVIVLSATLGSGMRAMLVQAFAEGRGQGFGSKQRSRLTEAGKVAAYPLLTRWSASTRHESVAVETDPGLRRSVAVRRVASRADAVQLALAAAEAGAAVAIICNAVDAAVETWRALRAAGQSAERCHLFHARFAMADRLAIEADVQRWFGRDSTSAERAGRILVATQVIEQSLDVDFDLMVSDLAPVDLIVQRAGRLWRHLREGRPCAAPVLHLLTPDPGAVENANWLNETLGPAAHVYRMPGVMWRTARELLAKGQLATPEDLRGLIETAYGESGDDLPPALVAGHGKSIGSDYGAQAVARNNTIKPKDGYLVLSRLSRDEDIGTRLGERSVTIRLARRIGTALVPLCRRDGADDRLNWALSEITLRRALLCGAETAPVPAPADAAAVAAVIATWPEWEKEIPLYEVAADGRLGIAERAFHYADDTGLVKG